MFNTSRCNCQGITAPQLYAHCSQLYFYKCGYSCWELSTVPTGRLSCKWSVVAQGCHNFGQRTTCWARRPRGVLTQGDFLIYAWPLCRVCLLHTFWTSETTTTLFVANLKSALSYAILMSTLLKLNSTLKGASLIKNKKTLWSHLNHVTTLFPQSSRKRPASRPASLASRTNKTVHLHYQAYYIFKFRWSEPQAKKL